MQKHSAMTNNFFSLLSSQWMITDHGVNSLIPSLKSLLSNGKVEKIEMKHFVMHSMDDDEDYEDIPDSSSSTQYITVLSMKTPLFKYDQMCGPIGYRSMAKMMKQWENNDNIIGVVLDIDSPGGQANGLAEFAKFINSYSKPVVTYSDGHVCSAAYYIAMASDYIIVNQDADFIGSIGTMHKIVNLDGVIEQQGGKVFTLYSDRSTRKNEEVRALLENNDSSLVINNILNPYADQFINDCKTFRPNLDASVFDGAAYRPTEALSLKLVDQFGTLKDAFDKVVALSNESKSASSTITNLHTMSQKSLPLVEAALGLDAPLAVTENGSYLNVAQLDQLESVLADNANENARLTNELATANSTHAEALTAANNARTTAENRLGSLEASINAVLDAAGLPAGENLEANVAALQAYAEEKGAQPGAAPTIVKTGADADGSVDLNVGGIDVDAYLNN